MTATPADARAGAIARTLDSLRDDLAQGVVDRHYRLRPELRARYGERGRAKCLQDTVYHLSHLSQALGAARPDLFHEYVGWAKVMLAGRGVPAQDLADSLRIMGETLRARLAPEDADVACACIEGAIAGLPRMAETLPSVLVPAQPLAPLAADYLAALLACDRRKASALVMDAVEHGAPIKDVYLGVFQQSQREIGRLWQMNTVSVAQEHYCTAATQMIMSQLYPRIFTGPRNGLRFIGASVSGDLHEVGMRIVTDFFEMDGWNTAFLGSSVPLPDLLRTLRERRPHVLGISATLSLHVGLVAQLIADLRAAPESDGVKFMVGGCPFNSADGLWRDVGADAMCADARGVVDAALSLVPAGAAA